MIVRNIVCVGALLGVVLVVRSGLYAALDAYGFWPFMAICAAACVTTVSLAFAWDWYEARR